MGFQHIPALPPLSPSVRHALQSPAAAAASPDADAVQQSSALRVVDRHRRRRSETLQAVLAGPRQQQGHLELPVRPGRPRRAGGNQQAETESCSELHREAALTGRDGQRLMSDGRAAGNNWCQTVTAAGSDWCQLTGQQAATDVRRPGSGQQLMSDRHGSGQRLMSADRTAGSNWCQTAGQRATTDVRPSRQRAATEVSWPGSGQRLKSDGRAAGSNWCQTATAAGSDWSQRTGQQAATDVRRPGSGQQLMSNRHGSGQRLKSADRAADSDWSQLTGQQAASVRPPPPLAALSIATPLIPRWWVVVYPELVRGGFPKGALVKELFLGNWSIVAPLGGRC